MSSPPSNGEDERKRRRPFERWRKIMIGAALVLLATAIARALLKEDMPDFLYVLGYALGLSGLAWGYATFFRSR